jgi:ABC-type uncharacterized transport system substrate-binding protein
MRVFAALCIGVGLAAGSAPALAHPHVWVTTRAEVLYAPDGHIAAIRHAWTFDQGYSAYAAQGLVEDGKLDPEKGRELAKTNTESLAENGFFTVLRAGGTKQAFDVPRDQEMAFEDGRLTLRFTLPLKEPAKSARLLLDVQDPTFFVDFALAEGDDAVRLTGAPPGCGVEIRRPKPAAAAADQKNLAESFFQALTGSTEAGAQFATRTTIQCR